MRYILLLLYILSSLSFAASFDCAKARASDEKAICTSPKLNDLDVEMSVKYHFLRGLFAMGISGEMYDDQKAWLKQRQQCKANISCLRESYRQRINQLDTLYNSIEKPI
ncbi:lysozyme inhibitor LprI family protein [Xenorhabdus cabanillasii]|uniref:Periplasmic protein n=1 Tax=Xenorhabdus cabanillasii JM26 TaxID=1427517 RepID=W1J606_9GAMM|nr:periplasmic protein [Xenorhabdus cabanillasii]PHM77060.1 periplasmic protein [Xenorhabdus cabanillasii JM26]CDL86159.1 putative periplasmic protein [Xenorhabdus cabanillasii JM26]